MPSYLCSATNIFKYDCDCGWSFKTNMSVKNNVPLNVKLHKKLCSYTGPKKYDDGQSLTIYKKKDDSEYKPIKKKIKGMN